MWQSLVPLAAGGATVKEPARILLVDSDILMRRGLARLLHSQEGFTVVGEAADLDEGLSRLAELEPDIALVDLPVKNLETLDWLRKARDRVPKVRILILTHCDQEEFLIGALHRGIQGYLLKDIEPEILYGYLHSCLGGDVVITGSMVPGLVQRLSDAGGRKVELVGQSVSRLPAGTRAGTGSGTGMEGRKGSLTRRQQEVLQLASQGATNREIAEDLRVSENTVKNHMQNILNKLHLENRAQAVAFAIRTGLIIPATFQR